MLPLFCRRAEQERFPQHCGGEFGLLHSGFALLSWLTHQEKGIMWPKVFRLTKSAELTDLQWDSEQEKCSLNHGASMALPAAWYALAVFWHPE